MQKYCGSTQQLNEYAILNSDISDNRVDNWDLHFPEYVDDEYIFDYQKRADEEQLTAEKKYYIHMSVKSEQRHRVILGFNAQHIHKYWLNGEIVYAREANSDVYTEYITVWLNEGENCLLMEMYQFSQSWRLMVMLYDYDNEMTGEINTLSGNHKKTQYDEPYFLRSPEWVPNEKEYRFLALLSDRDSYRTEYTYTVSYCTPDEEVLISEHQGIVGRLQTVDLSLFRQYLPHLSEPMRHLLIRVRFQGSRNNLLEKPLEIYPTDMVEIKSEMERELAEQLYNMSSEMVCWYRFCLTETCGQGIISYHIYRRMMEYREILRQIHAHEELQIRKYFEPYQYVLHSELDDRDVMLRVLACNMEERMEGQQLPLVLSISTNVYDNNCYNFTADGFDEGVIHADVTVRGATGGSYVGEASFFEIFHWICQRYPVDLSRVYLVGFCNGAHAALHMAQTHPHMFAGMYILSGYPEMPLINNLSNLPIYTVSSDADRVNSGVIHEMAEKLGQYENFYHFTLENVTHDFVFSYMFPTSIVGMLLRQKNNPYPRHIDYSTRCNRYLRSYWITLGGICPEETYAHVQADIESEDCIRIQCIGTECLTLNIPPEMHQQFTVVLNGEELHIDNSSGQSVFFQRRQHWQQVDSTVPFELRKGSGLLDVYLDSLRIVIPKNAGEITRKAAMSFAEPQTMTHAGRIMVSYPIYTADKLSDDIAHHNLIVFGRYDEYNIPDNLPVRCVEGYCCYKDKLWEGDYCVMQVVPAPYDNQRSVVYITYNNESSLNKMVFIRKIILPFASSGFHQYLNQTWLIWNNRKYYMFKNVDIH